MEMKTCECYIHSLKTDGKNVLAEATILERLGENDYLAEYNGVKCLAIFNPIMGRYYVDDVYGVIRNGTADNQKPGRGTGRKRSVLFLPERRNVF